MEYRAPIYPLPLSPNILNSKYMLVQDVRFWIVQALLSVESIDLSCVPLPFTPSP